MRKFFNTLAAVALSVAAAASLSACGGDDDEPDYKDPTFTEATLTTTLYVSESLMDVVDVNVTDDRGNKLSFEANTVKVSYNGNEYVVYPLIVTSSSKQLDIEHDLSIVYSVKADAVVPDKFDSAILATALAETKYSDGNVNTLTFPVTGLTNKGVFGNKLAEFVQTLNRSMNELDSSLDEDGLKVEF